MNALLVVYDIADPKRLRRVAKVMQGFGVRIQKSVFECNLTSAQEKAMLRDVESKMELEEDRVRVYRVPRHVLQEALEVGCPGGHLPSEAVVI